MQSTASKQSMPSSDSSRAILDHYYQAESACSTATMYQIMSNTDFSTLSLGAAQLANLRSLGYQQMTPIQAQCLPQAMQGKDLIAQAKTGSGKTAAFGLALLNRINPRSFAVQALVLCPTRELADQVGSELRRLARAESNIKLVLLCGGKPIAPQSASLQHGAHIIVGTPGRIKDHLDRKNLDLRQLRTLVLDEADRMLDMGFLEVISAIAGATPKHRQTLMFSATYSDSVRQISRSFQRDPVTVTIDSGHQPEVIDQLFYEVKKHERNNALLALFAHYQLTSAVVFCHTKKQCDEVAAWLDANGIDAKAIHGDLEQRDRDQVLVQFANSSCPVLVATDVAARGLDIKDLPAVINYELPRDAAIYVHRIGRTGRAGATGRALSLFTEAEKVRLKAIATFLGKPCICDVPASLDADNQFQLQADMVTIQFDAGRKHKLRPGDLLGALTGDAGLDAASIGKIDIHDQCSYVAIRREVLRKTLNVMANGKVKGRSVRARKVN